MLNVSDGKVRMGGRVGSGAGEGLWRWDGGTGGGKTVWDLGLMDTSGGIGWLGNWGKGRRTGWEVDGRYLGGCKGCTLLSAKFKDRNETWDKHDLFFFFSRTWISPNWLFSSYSNFSQCSSKNKLSNQHRNLRALAMVSLYSLFCILFSFSIH